jgi:hypothetical protein
VSQGHPLFYELLVGRTLRQTTQSIHRTTADGAPPAVAVIWQRRVEHRQRRPARREAAALWMRESSSQIPQAKGGITHGEEDREEGREEDR